MLLLHQLASITTVLLLHQLNSITTVLLLHQLASTAILVQPNTLQVALLLLMVLCGMGLGRVVWVEVLLGVWTPGGLCWLSISGLLSVVSPGLEVKASIIVVF